MPDPNKSVGLTELARNLIGRRIVDIQTEMHVSGGEYTLLSVWLGFSDGGVGIRSAGAGWGLQGRREPPEAFDMGGAGRIELHDPTAVMGLTKGLIDAVWIVHLDGSEFPIGVRWFVRGSASVSIYCVDDELDVGQTINAALGTVTLERVHRT